MATRGERYVQEFVIGFGFLSGIFFAIGVDPEGLIIQKLIELLKEVNPDSAGWLALAFAIVSILLLIVMILAAYDGGGIIGLIAVIFAFIAGAILLAYASAGVILLIIAIILGLLAPEFRYRPI